MGELKILLNDCNNLSAMVSFNFNFITDLFPLIQTYITHLKPVNNVLIYLVLPGTLDLDLHIYMLNYHSTIYISFLLQILK